MKKESKSVLPFPPERVGHILPKFNIKHLGAATISSRGGSVPKGDRRVGEPFPRRGSGVNFHTTPHTSSGVSAKFPVNNFDFLTYTHP